MCYVGGNHVHARAWLFIHMPNNEELFEAWRWRAQCGSQEGHEYFSLTWASIKSSTVKDILADRAPPFSFV